MANEKLINYTVEQEAELVRLYNEGMEPEDLAQQFNKSTRSVIAKLSRLGVYKSKTKSSPKLTKAMIVTRLEDALGLECGVLSTFEKADKEALVAALAAVEGQENDT